MVFGDANGAPAAYITREGEPVSIATLMVSDRGVERVFMVMNPNKLGALRS